MSDRTPSLRIVRLPGIGLQRKAIVTNLLKELRDPLPEIVSIQDKGWGEMYSRVDGIEHFVLIIKLVVLAIMNSKLY